MEFENEAKITLGDENYPLMLTTRAVKEIGKKYGGLDKLGELMTTNQNSDEAFDTAIWLIALLANQPILIYNRNHKGEEKQLLTPDDVELMTTPADLVAAQGALKAALSRGMSRSVISEPSKNA